MDKFCLNGSDFSLRQIMTKGQKEYNFRYSRNPEFKIIVNIHEW